MANFKGLKNQIKKIEAATTKPRFVITGFEFRLDTGEEDQYCVDAATAAGFPVESGQPDVDGFFYLSDEYKEYIDERI